MRPQATSVAISALLEDNALAKFSGSQGLSVENRNREAAKSAYKQDRHGVAALTAASASQQRPDEWQPSLGMIAHNSNILGCTGGGMPSPPRGLRG